MIQDIATVFWRDWIVLRHRLLKFILSRMVAPVLYMVAFGWGLARSVNTGGGSYLDFIVPGILALNSMNIAFNSLTPLCTETRKGYTINLLKNTCWRLFPPQGL